MHPTPGATPGAQPSATHILTLLSRASHEVRIPLILAAALVLVLAIYFLREILIPMAIALLLTFVLRPTVLVLDSTFDYLASCCGSAQCRRSAQRQGTACCSWSRVRPACIRHCPCCFRFRRRAPPRDDSTEEEPGPSGHGTLQGGASIVRFANDSSASQEHRRRGSGVGSDDLAAGQPGEVARTAFDASTEGAGTGVRQRGAGGVATAGAAGSGTSAAPSDPGLTDAPVLHTLSAPRTAGAGELSEDDDDDGEGGGRRPRAAAAAGAEAKPLLPSRTECVAHAGDEDDRGGVMQPPLVCCCSRGFAEEEDEGGAGGVRQREKLQRSAVGKARHPPGSGGSGGSSSGAPDSSAAVSAALAHVPSWSRLAAVLLALSLVVAGAALVALFVVDSLASFHEKHGAEFAKRAEASVRVLADWIRAHLHLDASSLVASIDALQKEWWTTASLAGVANALLAAAVTLLLLLYLLLDPRYDDPGGTAAATRGGNEDAAAAVSPAVLALRRMWAQIEASVHRYLLAKAAVSGAMGVAVWLVLGPILHVHLAGVFGLATFFLNFIPNVGALLAFALPLPVIFLDPRLTPAAQALAVIVPLALHALLGAVAEPLLFGSLLQLHPVVVLLALGAWFVLWGVPGAVLAVPITSVLCIALKTLAEPGAGVRPLPRRQSRYAAFAVRFLEDCVLDFAALAPTEDDEDDEPLLPAQMAPRPGAHRAAAPPASGAAAGRDDHAASASATASADSSVGPGP